jgi:hypothetical protein
VTTVAEATTVDVKTGARHSTGDMALLQSVHDSLVKLGVDCETKNHEISTETNPESAAAEEAAAKTPAVVDVASVTRRARVTVTGSALRL